jgi:Ser/Thr protein kinase RdoA (MazF antagonist)
MVPVARADEWSAILAAAGAARTPATTVLREIPGRRITVRHDGAIVKVFAPRERASWERERWVLRRLGGRVPWMAQLLSSGEVAGLGAWVVMSVLPGRPPWPGLDAGGVHVEIGRLAARLHALTEGIEAGPAAPATAPPLAGGLADHPIVTAPVRARIAELEEIVARGRRVAPCLLHGDWGTSNILLDEAGRGVAMVDWEDAHVGDPVDDLQWMCLHGFDSVELRAASHGHEEARPLGAFAAERLAVAAFHLAAEVAGWELPPADAERTRIATTRLIASLLAGDLPRLVRA